MLSPNSSDYILQIVRTRKSWCFKKVSFIRSPTLASARDHKSENFNCKFHESTIHTIHMVILANLSAIRESDDARDLFLPDCGVVLTAFHSKFRRDQKRALDWASIQLSLVPRLSPAWERGYSSWQGGHQVGPMPARPCRRYATVASRPTLHCH